MTDTLSLSLPDHPPSVNRMYRTVRNRPILSWEYRQWRHRSLISIPPSVAALPEGPWKAEIILKGLNRGSDIDNRIKAAVDLLRQAELTPDDRWLDWLLVRRVLSKEKRTIIHAANHSLQSTLEL